MTVTVAWQLLEPAVFVTVKWYVVVTVGETDIDPPVAGVTVPMPWSMLAEVGVLVVVQVNTELPTLMIVVGNADREQVGGGGVITEVKNCITSLSVSGLNEAVEFPRAPIPVDIG